MNFQSKLGSTNIILIVSMLALINGIWLIVVRTK
jgi:hypothetical protein